MEIKLQGAKELISKLKELSKRYPLAAAAAVYQEGMTLWASSAKKAPVLYGVLRNSAYVTPPYEREGQTYIQMGFGTVYAQRQHEETTWKHPRGGEAKYLEHALNELRVGYLERLGRRIQSNVEKGVESTTISAPTRPRDSGALRKRGVTSARRKRLAARKAKRKL